MKAIFLDRVNIVCYYDAYVRTSRSQIQLPSVICLKSYTHVHKEVRGNSKKVPVCCVRVRHGCAAWASCPSCLRGDMSA
jgi:hypothetical protein